MHRPSTVLPLPVLWKASRPRDPPVLRRPLSAGSDPYCASTLATS